MSERVPVACDAAIAAVPERERIRARCADLLVQLRPLLETPTPDATNRFRSAHEELAELAEDMASTEVVDCLVLIAHYFYLGAQPVLGLSAAAKGVAFAKLIENKNLLRRALSFLGIMFVDAGNLPSATECLLEALQVARTIGDSGAESPVWNNLGMALQHSAQYADALSCYERAAALAKESPDFRAGEKIAHQNIANCAVHLRDVRRGMKAARTAVELNPNPTTVDDCFNRVFAESDYARLLLEIGEIDLAEEHCRLAREFAAKAPSARSEYLATMITGLVDVHASRVDIGLTRLKKSLEHARKAVRSEVRDALSACVTGYEAAGQPDVALVYLHELLAMNREAKAAQVLATFEALATELGSDRNSDQRHDQLLTGQAAKLTASIDKCVSNLVTAAIDNALRAGHDAKRIFRVGRLAELFARSLGWKEAAAGELALAVRLMDVGSVVVPDELLRKPRALSAGEKKLVAEHTGFGAELLQRARLALLQPCIPVAKFHHERWDGTGPWGLQGEGVPMAARIAALADTLDSLLHPRPWREAMTLPAAVRVLRDEAGSCFDPALAERFITFVKELFWEHDRLDDFLAEAAQDNEYLQTRARLQRLIQGH